MWSSWRSVAVPVSQIAHSFVHFSCRSSRRTVRPVASSGKIDIKKQGMNSVPEGTIKQNLMGRSRFMKDKDWKDSQGRKGKVGRQQRQL
jgi:hypothetical protein